MLALILAAAVMAPPPQPVKDFARILEQTRALSAQLDGPSPIGMLVLMKLRREAENVCPLDTDEINAWIARNRLTDVEGYVMGALCESYWAGRQDSYEDLKKDIVPQP